MTDPAAHDALEYAAGKYTEAESIALYLDALRHLEAQTLVMGHHIRCHPYTLPELRRRKVPRRAASAFLKEAPLWRDPDHFAIRSVIDTEVTCVLTAKALRGRSMVPRMALRHEHQTMTRSASKRTPDRSTWAVGETGPFLVLPAADQLVRDDAQYVALPINESGSQISDGLGQVRAITARYTMGFSNRAFEELNRIDPVAGEELTRMMVRIHYASEETEDSEGPWWDREDPITHARLRTGFDVLQLSARQAWWSHPVTEDAPRFGVDWGYANRSGSDNVRHVHLTDLLERNGGVFKGLPTITR